MNLMLIPFIINEKKQILLVLFLNQRKFQSAANNKETKQNGRKKQHRRTKIKTEKKILGVFFVKASNSLRTHKTQKTDSNKNFKNDVVELSD